MTDPLEKDVLGFLGGYKPPAPPRDPILSLLPPAIAADLGKRPEFAAQLAKDRARGLTDEQIVAKIAGGQAVKPKRPAWAVNAPSTSEATNDALYGQPSGMETAVDTAIRAGQGVVGTVGALMERTGRKLDLPDPEPPRTPEQEAAMAKMRDIYSVGQPGSPVQQAVTGGIVEPALEAVEQSVMEPLAEAGVAVQQEATAWQEAVPRPKYARDFWEGMKTDPAKTLAIAAGEQLPQLALTISALAVSPELGAGVAWAQGVGDSYQEAKERHATEQEAQAISGVVGLTNMFFDVLPAGQALSRLGGATRPGVKGFLYDVLEQAVSEGATESVQEANQMLVTAALNAKDQGFTFEEFVSRVGEAGLSAFVLGGGTGVVTSGAGAANAPARSGVEAGETLPVVEVANEAVTNLPDATQQAVGGAQETGLADSLATPAPTPAPSQREAPFGALTPRTPRWAENHVDAIARFNEFVSANRPQGILDPDDLPFRLENLPLTRWQSSPADEFNAERGAQFWFVGDDPSGHPAITESTPGPDGRHWEGGPFVKQELFTPKNPLIVTSKTPVDDLGEIQDIGAYPDEMQELYRNVGRGALQLQADRMLADYARARGNDSILFVLSHPATMKRTGPGKYDFESVASEGFDIVLAKLEPGGGRPVPPSDLAQRVMAGDSSVRISPYFNPASQPDDRPLPSYPAPRIDERRLGRAAKREMSDADLERDVLGFLEQRGAQPKVVPPDIQDLAAASLAIGSSQNAGGAGPVEIVPGTGTGAHRQLIAVDSVGNEVGSIDYTVEPDGFRVHMIATGRRGSGAGRELMRAAAEDANGPMTGAASMTPEGEGFFRRIAETDPGLVSESVFARGVPNAGSTLAAPEQGGGPGVAAEGVRDYGRSAGVVLGPAQVAAEGGLNADVRAGAGRDVPEGERGALGPRLLEVSDRLGGGGPGEAGGVGGQADPATIGGADSRGAAIQGRDRGSSGGRDLGLGERGTRAADAERQVDRGDGRRDDQGSARPDRSLPARVAAKPGEGGFAVVPGAIKKPFMKWWRRRMMATKGLPRYYLDLKVRRDGRLAAKAARLEALSLDLARAMKSYKGPLTEAQLRVYLDDAYRGMNTTGLSGPMDEKQIERITARRQLSEIAQQRLREEASPDGGRLAPEFLGLLREMRSAQDSLERTLRRQGLLDDGSIRQLEREFGLYVHRQYEAPRNPRYLKWIKDQPLWRRAYDLTKSLWDRQAQANAAEQVVADLGLKRPITPGDFRQGDFVQIRGEESGGWKPKPEGEEELTRAAQKKVPKRPDIVEEAASRTGKAPPSASPQWAPDPDWTPAQRAVVDEFRAARSEASEASEAVLLSERYDSRNAAWQRIWNQFADRLAAVGITDERVAAGTLPGWATTRPKDTAARSSTRVPPALTFPRPDGTTARFEFRKKPGESLAAMKARVRAEAEAALNAAYPEKGSESLPSGRIGRLVQISEAGDAGQVEIRNEDGKRETVAVPLRRLEKAFGTRAQAIADVKRTLLDPSTREQFLEEYQIDAETFDDAVKDAAAANPPMTENEVWGLLQGYMTATGNRPVLPGGVPEGSKDMTALKKRSRMEDLQRMLRGEVRSVDWNFFTTTLKMATITAQHQFLVELEKAGKGDIFREKRTVDNPNTEDEKAYVHQIDPDFYAKSMETAKGREPGIDQDIVKQGSKRTAPLSDLFTTDEILEVLNESFDTKSYPEYLKWYMRAVMTSKAAATAYSWVSVTRNVWSQPLMLMANGVNPFNAPRFLRAGDLAYPLAAGNTSRRRINRMERYIELGIANAGTDLGDIKRMEKAAQVLREDIPKGAGSDKVKAGEGIVYGAGQAGGRAFRLTAERARDLYQAPDNQGKIQIFEAQLPLYRKAFPEKTEAEVEEYVAGQMHDTTQTYAMLYPMAQDLAAVPFFGTFISFRLEVIRNLYHAMRIAGKEIRSDNPELRKIGLRRTVGISAAMTLTAAIAGGLRHWLNMDDEDDDAARQFMAPWNKNSEIWFLKKGGDEITFIDASFGDYYAAAKTPFRALLRGDIDGMLDSMRDPFGEDITTEAIVDVLRNQTQEGFDVYNPEDSTLTRAKDIAKHLGAPMTPGTFKSISRVIDPERDTGTELWAFFGVRAVTINLPKELRRRVKRYQDRISDARWIEKKVIRKEGTEDAYAEAQRRSERALRRIVEDMVKDIQAARQLDMDESKITAALLESGVGKGDPAKGKVGEAGLLLSGDVDAVVQRYLDLNDKWAAERKELIGHANPDSPRTSDDVDRMNPPPWRETTLADIARAKIRGERSYAHIQPDGVPETDLQKKNRREIGETAKIWQRTLKERGVEQPNGALFGLGEYFMGEEIRRQGVNQRPDTAMKRLGAAGRRGIKEKGPEIGRRLAPLRPTIDYNFAKRYLRQSFTTETPDRRAAIAAKMEALWERGKRGKELWDQIRPMLDAKAEPGE